MTDFQTLRGMVDILPSETERWQRIETLARNHFSLAGIDEIRTPLLEGTELFKRGIGEGTDVVGKEMYCFVDRGDRSCTLRPEGTASVVRSVIQNGLLSQGPQRLWYGGPMFRYERPQAGRQRQFHQLGVEFFGLSSARSDAELISVAWDFLKDIGLNGLTLQLNSLGTLEDRIHYRIKLVSFLEEFTELLDENSKKQLIKNPLRILDSKNNDVQKLLDKAPTIGDSLSKESKERFCQLQQILKRLEIPFVINQKLVRGLDYYCQTAFEITSDQLGAQATVCGGGRYDDLVEQLGGPPTPSIGFAIGMERLIILLSEKTFDSNIPNVYLVNKGKEAELEALFLARNLRAANIKVELDNSGSSFGKQFKRANKSKASWAIVIGDEEIINGEIKIKSLDKLSNKKDELVFNMSDMQNIIQFVKPFDH